MLPPGRARLDTKPCPTGSTTSTKTIGMVRVRGCSAATAGEVPARIPEYSCSLHAWRDLLQELQPFPAQTVFVIHEASGVAAGSGQAIDEAGADRIGDAREHDRQRAGDTLQGGYAQGAACQDDIRRERNQFRRVSALAVDIVRAPAGVDPHIAAVVPAQFLQTLLERREAGVTV